MSHVIQRESRPWAAFFWAPALIATSLTMTGCSLQDSSSPFVATLSDAFPNDVETLARRLPYASLDMTVGGNGGLWILASQAGATTYWQSQDASVALRDGYLARTTGLGADLIDTQWESAPWQAGLQTSSLPSQPLSVSYTVTRTWRTDQGALARQTASATLECDPEIREVSLPLARIDLQRCEETLAWQSGDVTNGTLWRSPQDGRIWSMRTQPWPDAPAIEWKVAKPWW